MNIGEDYHATVYHYFGTATPLLHYIPRGIPEFTNHGSLHTVNVLRYVDYLTKQYPLPFTKEEKFILALATIFMILDVLLIAKNITKHQSGFFREGNSMV